MKLLLVIGVITMGLQLSDGSPGNKKPVRRPVVVELFTSEGCSSCPPADALLAELINKQPVEGVEIIPLAFHVDYWNNLGWADRFSDPRFTERQHEYAQAMSLRSIYTPQMVVDGSREFVGSDRDVALKAIRESAQRVKANVRLTIDGNRVQVKVSGDAAKGECDVLVAVTEDDLQSDVRRGENAGRKLSHAAVVRRLVRLGQTKGADWTGELEI